MSKQQKRRRANCGNCSKPIKWDEKQCWGWAEGTQCLCNDNLKIHFYDHRTEERRKKSLKL